MATVQETSSGSPYPAETETRLEDQSPSTKLVAYVLQRRSVHTIERLQTHTLLPRRTIQYALKNLQTAGLVEARVDYTDPRSKRYIWKETD